MTPNERITNLEGLTTAATKIDTEHNLRANSYRLVSSQGVLFTVSADTLRDIHALWDLAQSATSTNEVVLSDEDFEYSETIRLLLDVLVYGVTGRQDYRLAYIPDVIDFTLKYDCHFGYELCMAYIELAFAGIHTQPDQSAMFIVAAQLAEMRIAKIVVRAVANHICRFETGWADWAAWNVALVDRVPQNILRRSGQPCSRVNP